MNYMHIRILLIAFLFHSQAGFCQSTLVKDLSLFVDTTLRTDVPLTILQTEFPVTVSAGDEWSGKFTILNYGENIAHQSFKAQISMKTGKRMWIWSNMSDVGKEPALHHKLR
jgi:hypothetical protein